MKNKDLQSRNERWRLQIKLLKKLPSFQQDIKSIRDKYPVVVLPPEVARAGRDVVKKLRLQAMELEELVLAGKLPRIGKDIRAWLLSLTAEQQKILPPYYREEIERLTGKRPATEVYHRITVRYHHPREEYFREAMRTQEDQHSLDHIAERGALINWLIAKYQLPLSWHDMISDHVFNDKPFSVSHIKTYRVTKDISDLDQGKHSKVAIEIFPETSREEVRDAYTDARHLFKKTITLDVREPGHVQQYAPKEMKETHLKDKLRYLEVFGPYLKEPQTYDGWKTAAEKLGTDGGANDRKNMRANLKRYRKDLYLDELDTSAQ